VQCVVPRRQIQYDCTFVALESTQGVTAHALKGRKAPFSAALVATAAPALATAPVIEDLDDIAHKPSIAVLPFVNMSDDKSQEYFADGMTEDIITGLSCDSQLFVIARNSTFAYKGQSPDIRTVGKGSWACAMCWRAASGPSATGCASPCS